MIDYGGCDDGGYDDGMGDEEWDDGVWGSLMVEQWIGCLFNNEIR